MAQAYKLVLTVPVPPNHDVDVRFMGIKMCYPETGDCVLIKNRKHRIEKERVDSDLMEIIIFVVNDGTEIVERIDYMLDEEYELTPFVPIVDLKTGENLTWTINHQKSNQTETYIPGYVSPTEILSSHPSLGKEASTSDEPDSKAAKEKVRRKDELIWRSSAQSKWEKNDKIMWEKNINNKTMWEKFVNIKFD